MFDRYLHTITREDEIHEKRMIRGSKMLLQAMRDAQNGIDPRTPDKLMWCTASGDEAGGWERRAA